LTDTPPQLIAATYRFCPSTGSVSIVEDTLKEPNGIAISPDGKTMYISDTGAVSGTISPQYPSIHGSPFNATGARTIYKYDVIDGGRGLGNKRPIYLAQDWVPDGLKVAANGMVVTGAGHGVDVLDEYGTMILRVQTNYTVQNFAWVTDKDTGNLTELWMMGNGGISRVKWNFAGQELK
jgi:sugar lactone lactonase YvrE